jgi:excisionase family DNA binding protein
MAPAELAINLKEACRRANVGRSTMYKEINDGKLTVLKVGDRTLIEPPELERWLASKRVCAGVPVPPPFEPARPPAVVEIAERRPRRRLPRADQRLPPRYARLE